MLSQHGGRFGPAVSALYAADWGAAKAEALARFHGRGGPFPGRTALLTRAVRGACWQIGQEARQRLAQAEQARGATEGTATPLRAS